jgi:hypothetical protein
VFPASQEWRNVGQLTAITELLRSVTLTAGHHLAP